MNRRAWLSAVAFSVVGQTVRSQEAEGTDRDVAAVDEIARKAGLGPLRTRTSAHYVGIGNAAPEFIETALKLCEDLMADFTAAFEKRGFRLRPVKERLTIVVLADLKSFEAFTGKKGSPLSPGLYDLDTNRLVLFDNRADGQVARAERANSMTLFHEATHQLTFNLGLLARHGDVPLCISEGLATYGEVRRPNGSVKVGTVNKERLFVLKDAKDWIPIEKLLTEDALFDTEDERTLQLAYAESWTLIAYFLSFTGRDFARSKQLEKYLESIAERRDGEKRLDDARACFGDFSKLDAELRSFAKRPRG